MAAYIALALLLVGFVFLVAEIFTVGFGIFGIAGIVMIIASSALTFIFVEYGAVIVIIELVTVASVCLCLVRYIRRKQLYGKLILNETCPEDGSEMAGLEYFLGKTGTTKTPLKPFGTADFNGVQMEVCSDGAYISENKQIKVVDVSGRKITVKAINTN